MKIKIKCIAGSVFITLSFILVIGIISSIAMMTIKNSLEHVALISSIAQALYLGIVLLFLKLRRIDIQNTYGLKLVPWKEYLLPIAAAFCFSAGSNIVQSVAPIPQGLIGGMSDDMEKNAVVFVLSIFVVAPVVEEFVFRALIMTKIHENFSGIVSVLISATLFAFIHCMAGGIVIVIHAFLGGIIFAVTYIKTKSLFPAIAAHIFGNIGGYVPTVTNNLPTIVQYAAAACFLIAVIIFCAILVRRKEILL